MGVRRVDGRAVGFAATPLSAAGRWRQRSAVSARAIQTLRLACRSHAVVTVRGIFSSHPKVKADKESLETEAFLPDHHLFPLTRISLDCDTLIKMLSSQAPNRALRLSLRARHFSTGRALAAVSPYRSPNPSTNPSKKVEKREQSTAAAAAQAAQSSPARAVPSPAFNRSVKEDVQPLQAFRQPEMDHSFVGMNGGQIFHEMMLRHDVKHVCE